MKIAVCIKQVPTREWQPRLNDTKTWIRDTTLTVRLSRGGAADVSVDCSSLGLPGTPGQPWEQTFTGAEGGSGGATSTPA